MANPFQSILPGLKKSSTSAESRPEPRGLTSYKKGTRFVPRTGAAKLEKGEAVLNKKQAKKWRRKKISGAAGALGAGKKKKKVSAKTKRLTKAAGHEIKVNPPKILAKTAAKSGAKQAAKQKVAIMLSKARSAGADIPKA
jgi:hypothetical protein